MHVDSMEGWGTKFYYPGERSALTTAENLKVGIPVSESCLRKRYWNSPTNRKTKYLVLLNLLLNF